jgi:hypothetical protein
VFFKKKKKNKAAAPSLVIEKAVERHKRQEKQKEALNPTKKFGKSKRKTPSK